MKSYINTKIFVSIVYRRRREGEEEKSLRCLKSVWVRDWFNADCSFVFDVDDMRDESEFSV